MPDARTQLPGAASDLALTAHLEPLVEGARVLWVGTDAAAPARWSRRAASVRALLPEDAPLPPPDRRAPKYGHLRPGGPAFRPGSFDLVVAPDLGAVGLDDEDGVARLRRGLADGGSLVIGLAVGDAPDDAWDRLVELSDAERVDVRLFGQARIGADTFAELDGEEPIEDVVFDGTLVEGDRADGDDAARFLAVAGPGAGRLDGLLVVQTPAAAVQVPAWEQVDEGWDEDDEEDDDHGVDDGEATATVEALTEHAEALERALDEAKAEAASLREARDRALAARDRARAEADAAKAEAARLRERASRPTDDDPDDDGGYAGLERSLAERARTVKELQDEVRRRGALVRDLVERLRAGGDGVRGDAMDIRGARDAAVERALDAELARTQAQYRIDELEAALARAGQDAPPPAPAAQATDGAVVAADLRASALEAERDAARGRADRLAGDLEDATRAAELREGELRALRSEIDDARARLEAERRRAAEATGALADARALLADLGHDVASTDGGDAGTGTA